MEQFLSALGTKPDVQAVYILSSSAVTPTNSSRFDQESDFDVALVLDIPMDSSEWRPQEAETYRLLADRIPSWVPNFLFHVPMPWGQMEVNIHQLIFQYECDPRTVWPGDKCDVYLNKSEKLVDRGDRFAQLVERKVEAGHKQLARERDRLANRITWDIREMPLRQARRLGPEAGHYLLNMALDEVIDCVYAAAGQFTPNQKWKLPQLVQRSLVTPTQAGTLYEAIRCEPSSLVDLERRVDALEQFCDSVDGLVATGPAVPPIRKHFQSTIQLRANTCADLVSSALGPPLAATLYDLVNYHLCGSSVDLVATLRSDSLFESLQSVAPQIREQLKPILDGGHPNVDLHLQHADEAKRSV
jgi:hypothetical protein